MTTTKFTVVLMRDKRLNEECEPDAGDRSFYIAHVDSVDKREAVPVAIAQVLKADRKDLKPLKPSEADYHTVCVFDGHQEVALFGFQL